MIGARAGLLCLVRTCTEMCQWPEKKGPHTSKSHPVFISLSREDKCFTKPLVSFAKPVLNKLLPVFMWKSPFPQQAQLALGSNFSHCPTQAHLDFPVLLISCSSSCPSHILLHPNLSKVPSFSHHTSLHLSRRTSLSGQGAFVQCLHLSVTELQQWSWQTFVSPLKYLGSRRLLLCS